MKKSICNEADKLVEESIKGLLMLRSDLARVSNNVNAVVRSDIDTYRQRKVTLISGGGSGHEPAHCGYIGDGMLSCAVLGNIFASPSVENIYQAILRCASPLGVLLIVKNYTGDRLNFGMALERAKADGVNIRMIIIDDDCTLLSENSIAGRRGVAGTLFIHKIAGAKAMEGGTLEEVYIAAEEARSCTRSIGVGLTCCNLPGHELSKRLQVHEMEVGIGIHGEPGRSLVRIPVVGLADEMVKIMVELLHPEQNESIGPVAVMINNLGSTTELELNAFAGVLLPKLANVGAELCAVYVGTFMTALDMHGISLSILKCTNTTINQLLQAPTLAPAWKKACTLGIPSTYDDGHAHIMHTDSSKEKYKRILKNNPYLVGSISAICTTLIESEKHITNLDTICGDGDCGHTILSGAKAVNKDIEEILASSYTSEKCADSDSTEWAIVYGNLANRVSESMGGTLGAIVELMLRAMCSYQKNNPTTTNFDSFAHALEAGAHAIRVYGGAQRGMRTMIDALEPALASLLNEKNLSDAAIAAERGAADTAAMTGLAGRSSYVNPEALVGIPDPGAVAVSIAFKAAAQFDRDWRSLHN